MASSNPGNGGTVPDWMALDGENGAVTYLQLLPKKRGSLLPKNPFIISKTIKQHCGQIENAYSEQKGTSMVLKVRGKRQVTSLLSLTKLIDGTEIDIVQHESKNQVRGVVSCGRSLDCTDPELLDGMSDQGVVNVRRIIGKDRKPSATMILTFQGTELPKHVFFGFTRAPVKTYVPAPMQCFTCYKFGHTKARCQAKPICRICSKEHELVLDENQRTICNNATFCINCSGNHSPAMRTCPKYVEEQEITKIRSEQDVSFGEARKILNARQINTYATAVAGSTAAGSVVQQRISAAQAQESDVVTKLRQELVNTKKALDEANATKKELAEARKALAELAEARNALEELALLKKELAELKAATPTLASAPIPTIELTKQQKKALKKQEKQRQREEEKQAQGRTESQSPESKRLNLGQDNIPWMEKEIEAQHEKYHRAANENLLDENGLPMNEVRSSRSRSRNANGQSSQSRSRSPM